MAISYHTLYQLEKIEISIWQFHTTPHINWRQLYQPEGRGLIWGMI